MHAPGGSKVNATLAMVARTVQSRTGHGHRDRGIRRTGLGKISIAVLRLSGEPADGRKPSTVPVV
jgi:hypothetical protein